MSTLKTASIYIAVPFLITSATMLNVNANEMATVTSLDEIIAQNSEIPALLTTKPLELPTSVSPKSHQLPSSKNMTTSPPRGPSSGEDNARFNNVQNKKITELSHKLSLIQGEKNKKIEALQKELKKVKQEFEAQNQRLRTAPDRLESDRNDAVEIKQALQKSEEIVSSLKKQITAQKADQVAKTLDFVSEKNKKNQSLMKMEQSLASSQSEINILRRQYAELTTVLDASAKAQSEA
uniref:hypothetical protein n=1 Tax=Lelliottia sp. WAP21 TaxID=2877426 RepID=UPI001F48BF51